MKRRSLISACAMFFACMMIVIGCANPATQMPTQTGGATNGSSSKADVRMGFSAWPGWFPWQVAQDLKLFDATKVSVDLKWFDGYLESITALSTGQIDANSQTLNDTVSSVAGGADQVVVLVNDNSTGNDQIIVRSGIDSVADLKGKKIAAEEGTVDHFLLLLGLEKAGLKPTDITFVPLETGKAAAAFAAGQVDGVGVFAPFTTQALTLKGSKALFTSKEFPGAISDHLVFSRQFVNAHADKVQAMVDSWFETLNTIKTQSEPAIAIMAKRAGVSVEDYKAYNDGTRIFSVEENIKAFQPGSDMTSLPYAAQQISQFLVRVGLAKTTPKLDTLFDDRFVKAYAAKKAKV
jgi:NitT/TauT family transport system substrate-binding protein